MTEPLDADVIIVGGGPAGAATAIFCAERGLQCLIVERAVHPRFHIGEALTGSAGKLLRSLGLGGALDEQHHAVKNGGTVYGAKGTNSFFIPAVDALPDGGREPTTTWQVRRDLFDKLLLDEAVKRGAGLCVADAEAPIVTPGPEGDRITGLRISPGGSTQDLRARFVVDASGMRGFLHQTGVTSPKERGRYAAQLAVYTHMTGTDRDPGDELGPQQRDNTALFYRERHHWAWFIPVNEDCVSVGVVIPSKYFRSKQEPVDQFFRRELAELNPALARRTCSAEATREIETVANYSYRIRRFAGPGWACVGDAHRFVDPIFAFGVHFALFEARMLSEAIDAHLTSGSLDPLDRYQRRADSGQDVVQDLIDAFWNEPLAFGYLTHRRHHDDIIDLFAGRIYDIETPSAGLEALRRINAAAPSTPGERLLMSDS